ncbi:MAG: GGDEF domain-containing protein [Pseudolabrys sp.]|nr:GGDEF domain-containing protein [Pseudolabrys sp.]MDP2294049.1 GGDEF domain-containing protein [Pseudolabrys sp.]
MSRDEFLGSIKGVFIITMAMVVSANVLITIMLVFTDFRDAALHYALATIFPLILTPTGTFPLLVMSHRLRLMKNELEGLLRLDALTEMPNRRAFFELAEKTFRRSSAVTLMMVDIDHFKRVNDTYGHDTGDRVLRSIGQSIQHIVAETADAGVKFAARIGGEEFAVLIEGLTAAAAEKLAGGLVAAIERSPVQGGGRSIKVTVSVGVAHRRTSDSPDMVLRAADNACYRAKRLGRNQWRDAEGLDVGPPATPVLTAA